MSRPPLLTEEGIKKTGSQFDTRTPYRILWVFLAALALAHTSIAQEGAHVWTVAELFTRNIGTTQQQRTQFPPHKIVGNVYYVGTESLSSFLVVTPAGNILIDSTYEVNVPVIQASIAKLGFKFSDIKIVLGSHAHGDHQEADAMVAEMTGAKDMAMTEDLPALQTMRTPSGKACPMYQVVKGYETEVNIEETAFKMELENQQKAAPAAR